MSAHEENRKLAIRRMTMPPYSASSLSAQTHRPSGLTTNLKSVSDIKSLAQDLHTESMTALFDSGWNSDITVRCGNRLWQLHRIILSLGSEYFKLAFSEEFKEGTSGIIELKEDDAQYVGILLRYLYAHDYQIDDNVKPPLIDHARVYAIADKYSVGLLKELAIVKFSLALRDTGTANLPSLIRAIEVVYASTLGSDRGLRDCLKPKLIEFKKNLRSSDEFMELFVSGLGDGDFAVDVLDAWAGFTF